MAKQRIAFDYESTGLHLWKGDGPFAFVFVDEDENVEYYELDVDPWTREVIPDKQILERVRETLENPDTTKIGANIKFDIRMAEYFGIEVKGELDDVLHMAHVCKSDEHRFALNSLAMKYLRMDNADEKELQRATISCRNYARKQGWKIGEEVAQDYWLCRLVAKYSPEHVARFPNLANLCEKYCTLDGLRTLGLDIFYQQVLDKEGVRQVYERERRLFPCVYEMETRGVRVNTEVAAEERKFCEVEAAKLRPKLVHAFGEFGKKVSDAKLRHYLFSSRKSGGLAIVPDADKVTAIRELPQVTKDVLEALAPKVPILQTKIEFEKYQRCATSYFSSYINFAVKEDGEHILHANFRQCGPKTGRLSCTDPPLQIIPKRAPKGDVLARVRRPFGPREGCIWLHNDYKSIEARIYADEADETDMLDLFARDMDVYVELVSRVQEMVPELNLAEKYAFADSGGKAGTGARQICKNNHLGWQYGEGIDKLARAMFLEGKIAEQVINGLKMAFPKGLPFMKYMQRLAKRLGFVENRFGRKTPIPPTIRKPFEKPIDFSYKAVNYLIQPTAADIMKEAMIRCHDYVKFLQRRAVEVWIVMTIHDELVLEFLKADLTTKSVREIRRLMSSAAEEKFNKVKFPIDSAITRDRWDVPEKLCL